MSSHYSYDIDERNLRNKLKGNETPFTEDVWLKFESYQQANPKPQGIDEVVKKISFTINRNVVLPIVFGAIIISFSLLLFNFINIKSKPKNNLVVANNALKPEVKKETPKPVEVKKTIPIEVKKDSVTITTPSIVSTPTLAAITPTVAAVVITEEKKTPPKENIWIALESDKIFEDPNKASKVIGEARKKEKYNALEETVYFIKVEFTKNGKQEFGYIRKGILSKEGATQTHVISQVTNSVPRKKREKKSAETLEPIKAPTMLSSSNEEPELK
ncbi:MAG: hypothetical protein SFY56_11900 [Bacteroidota bacterium]|nr:hypothetical protein [Bacteroidota bacterium]